MAFEKPNATDIPNMRINILLKSSNIFIPKNEDNLVLYIINNDNQYHLIRGSFLS
ncbi:hypothetical protein fsci_07300 [Francisella sciaenopsi]|uniref:Uncharacterized protein n=1 Tax=Francisella sciaenopsi TaxID=3055034 RepID=A0ABQ6PFL0_9GAMM